MQGRKYISGAVRDLCLLRAINMNRSTNTELKDIHFVYDQVTRCCSAVPRNISNGAPTKSSNDRSGTLKPCGSWIIHIYDAGFQEARNSMNTSFRRKSVVRCGPNFYNQRTGDFRCHQSVSINCLSCSAGRSLTSISSSECSITAALWSPTTYRVGTLVSPPKCGRSVLLDRMVKQTFQVKGCSICTPCTIAPR